MDISGARDKHVFYQEMEREACPEKVSQRADILYWNGFSGFQGPPGGGKDLFVLCWINLNWDEASAFERNVLPEIRKQSHTETLEIHDWIGRDYLSIHWQEYGKRFLILSMLLSHGIPFQTQTKGMPPFRPKEDGLTFSQELLEKSVMKQTQELIDKKLYDMIDDGKCEEWNWTTEEGKKFSHIVKKAKGHRYDSTRTNFYEWDLFKEPYDLLTLV